MNELEAQRLVIKSVRVNGGYAFKLSNRFLVGIPDLLIQMPGRGTSLWEVKIRDYPKKESAFHIQVTPPQLKRLRDFYHAGGRGGVISFLRVVDGLSFHMMPLDIFLMNHGGTCREDHVFLAKGKREQTIWQELSKF